MTKSIKEWEKETGLQPTAEMEYVAGILQKKFEGGQIEIEFNEAMGINRNITDEGPTVIALHGATMGLLLSALHSEQISLFELKALDEILEGTSKAVKEIIANADDITLKPDPEEVPKDELGTIKELFGSLPKNMQEQLMQKLVNELLGE